MTAKIDSSDMKWVRFKMETEFGVMFRVVKLIDRSVRMMKMFVV